MHENDDPVEFLPDIPIPYAEGMVEPKSADACLLCGKRYAGKRHWVQLDKSLGTIEDPMSAEKNSGGRYPIIGSCWTENPQLVAYQAPAPPPLVESRSGRKPRELSERTKRLIREEYPAGDTEALCKKVDMTMCMLRYHAHKLGLSRVRPPKVVQPQANDGFRAYTREEVEFVAKHHLTKSAAWIAEKLGRTLSSVDAKVYTMKRKAAKKALREKMYKGV